jgi:hypothetical protein
LTKRLLYSFLLSLLFLVTGPNTLWAQTDTTLKPADSVVAKAKDTVVPKKVDSTWYNHSPRKAAIRSAIIPGWGQAYNKQYWKIPIVYAALGTTAYIYAYNITNYRDLRFAYKAMVEAAGGDSTNYKLMKPQYRLYDAESIRYYRNEFRKNVDYTVLVFILFWGLNVADAAAAAHLRTFDVSPDLTFKIKPGYSEMGNTAGLSLVLAFK